MTSRLSILLVEDTPSDIRLTEEALKDTDLNYELTVLNDGVQAMEYFNKVKGTKDQPDLVLLDLNMPRKNGHEVLMELKDIAEFKDMPVILLTVSRDEDEILRALDLKMNYYIGKPVTTDKLNHLLKAIRDLNSEVAKTQKLDEEDAHVRYVMAGNPHTSPAMLAKLAIERNPHIRMRVAENGATPRELLEALANDPNPEVRMAVAENPQAPPDLLDRLAKDPSEDVRLSLASNPKLPRYILMRLSRDEQPHIAALADKSLAAGDQQRSA